MSSGWLPTAGDRLESRISLRNNPLNLSWTRPRGITHKNGQRRRRKKVNYHKSRDIYVYSKMGVCLKKPERPISLLVDKAFQRQIGRNLEVYVDDLVIKSRTEEEIIRDIAETFKTLRQINMKLNPKKCSFGMQEGMFLGYKVNTDRLKVCPNKADAVLSLPSPRCLKDVQKLNGKLASLNRFLSKSAEKSLPFFKTLKKCTKKSDFQWTQEAEAAFKQMKKLIAELPMLTAPKEKEELIIYLAAAKEAISAVLMTEREANKYQYTFVAATLQGWRNNNQLHGKYGVKICAQCLVAAEKILPSTCNHCNHGSADKATIVKLINQWENAKVEV
ncbi:reverse transcriptase domain-containing protein [Tanacetum coccineum]